MTRLINADEIKKREHDVILADGAKHRCFDTTRLYEIPTVDAIPVSYFASELAEIKLILKRKDISNTYREELEAEKRYLVGWINHWRWETERGCKGLTFKPLSDDEIIDAERKEE